MRCVLHIIDTLETGGAEKSLLAILPKFTRYRPVVVVLYQGLSLLPDFTKEGVKVIPLNHPAKYDFALLAKRVSKIVEEERPVLIHSTLFRSDMVSRKLKRKFPEITLVNSLVNNSYTKSRYAKLGFLGKLKLAAIHGFDAATARRVDAFISNSETIKERSIKDLRIDETRIRVIYRGRDKRLFTGIENTVVEKLNKELEIAGKKVVLNVSRLLERKGQLDLLKAFVALRAQEANWMLLIVGEGPFRPTLEAFIMGNNLADHVKLLGSRSDIPALLARADVFVFPSYYEGIPGALIEAMFAAKVIVASDIPENMECVNSSCAKLFPVGDIDALTGQIKNAVIAADSLSSLGAEAQRRAEDRFDIHSIVHQYEDFYHNELKKTGRGT